MPYVSNDGWQQKLPPFSFMTSEAACRFVLYRGTKDQPVWTESYFKREEDNMIEVTRLNDTKLTINAELIEKVEESPDTVITLTSGNKIIVKESRQEIKNLVILYKKEIYGREL
jgi:flagellar protein FlbD